MHAHCTQSVFVKSLLVNQMNKMDKSVPETIIKISECLAHVFLPEIHAAPPYFEKISHLNTAFTSVLCNYSLSITL